MITPVFCTASNGPATNAVNYASPSMNVFTSGWTSVVANQYQIFPCDGEIRNLRVSVNPSPGTSKSYVYDIYKNGNGQSVSVTISGASTTGSDTTNSVSVSTGDRIAIRCSPSGNPSANFTYVCFEYWSANAKKSFLIGNGTGSVSGSDTYWQLNGLKQGSAQSVYYYYEAPVAIAGSFTGITVYRSVSPGGGKTVQYILGKNGSDTALTVTCNSSGVFTGTGSVSVSAGDLLYLRTHPSSAPSAGAEAVALLFEPTVDGNSIMMAAAGSLPSTSTTYLAMIGDGPSNTEGSKKLLSPACDIKNLYANVHTALGAGKSYTLTFRKNGSNTSLTTTLADANTQSSDTSNTSTQAAGDFIALQTASAGSPSGTNYFSLGLALYIAPNVYDVSVSDSITVAESSIIGYDLSLGDSVSISESLSMSVSNPGVAVNDTITVTESVGRALADQVSSVETISVTESVTCRVDQNINKSESISITESTSGQSTISGISVNDAASITESTSVTYFLPSNKFESVAITESVTMSNPLLTQSGVVDMVTLTESLTVMLLVKVSVSDTVSLSEFIDLENQLNTSVSDTVPVNEAVTTDPDDIHKSVSDSISLTEFSTTTLSDLQCSVFELVLQSEDTSVTNATSGTSRVDTVTVTESLSVILQLSISVVELVTNAEALTMGSISLPLSVSDSLSLTEYHSANVSLNSSVYDSVTVSEYREFLSFRSISLSDTGSGSDSLLLTSVKATKIPIHLSGEGSDLILSDSSGDWQ